MQQLPSAAQARTSEARARAEEMARQSPGSKANSSSHRHSNPSRGQPRAGFAGGAGFTGAAAAGMRITHSIACNPRSQCAGNERGRAGPRSCERVRDSFDQRRRAFGDQADADGLGVTGHASSPRRILEPRRRPRREAGASNDGRAGECARSGEIWVAGLVIGRVGRGVCPPRAGGPAARTTMVTKSSQRAGR